MTTAIRAPTKDPANHQVVLQQMKEILETGLGIRGDPTQAYVRVSDLVSAGVIKHISGVISPPGTTAAAGTLVSQLPVTQTVGQRAFVVDASATTFLSVVVGGGTNRVPVVWDGSHWVIG